MDAPGRTPSGRDDPEPLKGGCWCAPNQVPKVPDKVAGFHGFGKLKRIFRRAVIVAIACVKLKKNPEVVKEEQVRVRLDTMRELWKAENRERLCMAREERRNRKNELETEMARAAPLLEDQISYEKEWSKLCQNIQNMPRILNRLRFMMGSNADGGGIIIMTEDPATKRMLNILSIPVLYPEDEENLVSQMQVSLEEGVLEEFRFRGLVLYIGGDLCNVEWCIRQL